jgi:hypothetical protein
MKIGLKITMMMAMIATSYAIEMKGINFVSVPFTQARYSHMNAKKSLAHVKDTGANWISIPIAYFQEERNSSEVTNIRAPMTTRDRINSTPTNKEINDVVTMAKNQDLKVMLMPVVEINRPGFVNSRRIGDHFSPYEFRRWFQFYKEHLVNLGKLAEENGAEMICVGHNLNVLAHQENYWNELIDAVREVYSGKLTYSSSSHNEFKKSGFWKKLDYIGLIADFEYKNHHKLTGEEITDAMKEFIRGAEYMAKVWKKPVFVSRAFSHSAKDISQNRVKKITHETQATFYRTLLQAVYDHEKIFGIFWGDWVADHRFGGKRDGSLSPQLKPSELVLREFFGGEKSLPDLGDSQSEHKMYCKHCHDHTEIDL